MSSRPFTAVAEHDPDHEPVLGRRGPERGLVVLARRPTLMPEPDAYGPTVPTDLIWKRVADCLVEAAAFRTPALPDRTPGT
jgi:hypothetical protein